MSENLMMPGNPRYQPKGLREIFGYDRLYRPMVLVELAVLQVLYEIGIVPPEIFSELTLEKREELLAIRTTEVDKIEREVTKHDVRALVRIMQEIVGPRLALYIHVPLTSYDVVDTGRILQFRSAYDEVIRPSLKKVVLIWADLTEHYAGMLQIGRTHGQHALPITVGFFLATILNRIVSSWEELNQHRDQLRGKISGAVGAYNAQVGLGIASRCGEFSFEHRVLDKLGLPPAPISTQILPPEPLARFLYDHVLLSAVFAQFGRDCRSLMRSEIQEISEAFGGSQVGSSTMAHKRNPINFENLEGQYTKIVAEMLKVNLSLVSEHQRDLTGSCVMRDFPAILIILQAQLDTLLRESNGVSFLERIRVDEEALKKNFQQNAHLILSELLYLTLQIYGYPGDAHELVNRELVPEAKSRRVSLFTVFKEHAEKNPALRELIWCIPLELVKLLEHPEKNTGLAEEKALMIAQLARAKAQELCP